MYVASLIVLGSSCLHSEDWPHHLVLCCPSFSVAFQNSFYPRSDVSISCFILMLHQMHEMQTIVIDDPDVCQSVCHAALLCKHGGTDQGFVWGGDSTQET